ncbi:hypothetical protein [Dyella sp.]|uniref:hypothetical protein n=1 Tax=Dyella sp. TaxID=1869338 RepID=UPI002ED3E254
MAKRRHRERLETANHLCCHPHVLDKVDVEITNQLQGAFTCLMIAGAAIDWTTSSRK